MGTSEQTVSEGSYFRSKLVNVTTDGFRLRHINTPSFLHLLQNPLLVFPQPNFHIANNLLGQIVIILVKLAQSLRIVPACYFLYFVVLPV